MNPRLLAAIAMPLLMLVGALAAWLTRNDNAQRPAWRDDSLDEWRREREAQAEAERLRRLEQQHPGDPSAGDDRGAH